MTEVLDLPVADDAHERVHEEHHGPTGILKWLTSTDHKVIGMSYTVTSVIMMVIGGIFAEIIRAQLVDARTARSSRSPSTTSCSRCTAG